MYILYHIFKLILKIKKFQLLKCSNFFKCFITFSVKIYIFSVLYLILNNADYCYSVKTGLSNV